ncbi:hypothetical protein X797_007812 [Metarhizium robertsii]|uniref:Uncharacterized protein n=1 Tax=Metarhizium robertsii TaxID=568076 RepID=A0A0A1USN2_9HYPO|nr:hypothetical protein X797_007812 [Metarhizium robertsii]
MAAATCKPYPDKVGTGDYCVAPASNGAQCFSKLLCRIPRRQGSPTVEAGGCPRFAAQKQTCEVKKGHASKFRPAGPMQSLCGPATQSEMRRYPRAVEAVLKSSAERLKSTLPSSRAAP